jgi:hypothetical protein
MELLLPPRHDGSREKMNPGKRRVIIIGANGAGKTRFTEKLINELPARAFRISALNALYRKHDADPLEGSIDRLYEEAAAKSPFWRSDLVSQFERLSMLLIHDEMIELLARKVSIKTDLPRESRLDRVINAWQEIFPGNKVLRESGKLVFSRGLGDVYSYMKLSDGEKAVLYYFGAVTYAPKDAVVFVDNPGIFLHPSITTAIWDRVEALRPDCSFIYTTHDLEFLTSRSDNRIIWVRDFDATTMTWDYAVLPPDASISDDLYMALIGTRKPVLFIEGDATHSIDAKLYPLVFKDYTVRSLGSCNKVIEATRTFNDLNSFHHLDSHGIVDRDRRDEKEVRYLRDKKIFVPDVAEIENILMLEEVIRTVAKAMGRNETRVFEKVKKSVIAQFKSDIKQQALLHTRHRVKRTIEYRIDARFPNVQSLEEHMVNLVNEIKPRQLYENFCRDFHNYAATGDYPAVLKVYNQKSMLPGSGVAALCGLNNKENYIETIIQILRQNGAEATRIRNAVFKCFGIDNDTALPPKPSLTVINND